MSDSVCTRLFSSGLLGGSHVPGVNLCELAQLCRFCRAGAVTAGKADGREEVLSIFSF